MKLLLALAIALLGLVLVVLAILALRDESPQWVYRIRRPWQLLFLGILTLVVALIVNATRTSMSERVSSYVGREASCEPIGTMLVGAKREDVHACVSAGGTNIGCFAWAEGKIVDLTRRAQQASSALPDRC